MADKKIPLDNTKAMTEFIKSLVRPFTNAVLILLVAVMVYEGRFEEIPLVVLIGAGLIVGQNALERGKKRMKEINSKDKTE